MSEWKALSSITSKIGSGSTPRGGNSVYSDSGISFIRSQNVLDMDFSTENLAFINDNQAEKLNNVIVEKNDILLNITGDSIARCTVVPEEILPARVNQHVSIIRCKNTEESKYVMYYLQYMKKYLLQISKVGGTRNALTKEAIGKLPIKLSDDCNKISKILDNIDQKIQINNQINQELEDMAKTLYDYWFVQFDFPDQNGKPYKSSGGKMVYHPELKREIPEGWGVARLGELQITTGKRDANFGTENGKYDFWTTSNNPIKSDEFSFEGKAILIAGNGNFYVNFTEGKFEAYQRTYVIQSEDENMLIFMYMACLQSVEKLRKGSNGSIIKYITIGDVNNIVSPYNKKVVDEFVKVYSPLIDLISKNKRQNQELTQLRDWLLPMLMNGQVKVE
ncbi:MULTISPECIES: restriction endonuclease subunit S [Streptococcus]|uniref:restriction endonuclease subunit S n=1 Tax=Streptococcus TaxID=1301 RepID=UPI00352D43DF